VLDDSDVLTTTWHGMALDVDILLERLDNFVLTMMLAHKYRRRDHPCRWAPGCHAACHAFRLATRSATRKLTDSEGA
jgi:hypothetical protein